MTSLFPNFNNATVEVWECINQKLDDEYHFLLECTKLSELRKKCIPRYFYLRPSMFKCVQLLNSNDTKTIRMLGRYVYQAFSQII